MPEAGGAEDMRRAGWTQVLADLQKAVQGNAV